MTNGLVNIIIIIAIILISIGIVEFWADIKRALRFHKVKKIRESRKISDMFCPEWKHRGYKSESDFINDIDERC